MTLAIAVTPDFRVAGHFAKAPGFAIYDASGALVDTLDNDANASGCQQKKKMMAQFRHLGVSRVVLKNIGERSLARLLGAGIQVDSVRGRATVSDVLAGAVSVSTLTEASQGRPCKPKSSSHKCCGSHSHDNKIISGGLAKGDAKLKRVSLSF
ncbi:MULTISPECIES: NifB/NifX family molybdenum-iron cluster-binding protein [Ferrimonas]|uniref:NifB/NifX family molybdenum-iron cluster-binding protein n=1 Tax=Ferrimonas TaxID=44011 RepID=UPI0004223542|nr:MULTISPECIES: NifB/NifX family molybdenum-iron cluster-binding protein [Ferrimonas]USD38029.1 hypothetical protein J8Z22_02355 [Ferrimonas sp. SCSIO 43195]